MNTIAINKIEINANEVRGVDRAPPYRFKLMQGAICKDGKFERARTVGLAYLKEGQGIYSLRLWMLSDARFYLIASQKTASHYLLMTREPNQKAGASSKYHWNIVGNGQVETMAGVIRLQFDLLPQPIYMSLFPEERVQAQTNGAGVGDVA
jgi:hypothetical protein